MVNLQGKIISEVQGTEVDLSTFIKGTYVVLISDESNSALLKKVKIVVS